MLARITALTQRLVDLEPVSLADWGVDSVNGSDLDVGSVGKPLKSLAGLFRRWSFRPFSPSLSAISLTLSGNFASEVLAWNAYFPCPVTVLTTPTVEAIGVVTAFTAWSAPSTDSKLSDTTTPIVWTSHVGRRIRLTSGTNSGACATILKDLGSNQCRVGIFVNTAGTQVSPAVNDTFVIETLPCQIGGFNCFSAGPGAVIVRDFGLRRVSTVTHSMFAAGGNPAAFKFFGCDVVTDSFTTSFSTNAFQMLATKVTSSMFTGKGATANLIGCALFGTLTVQQGGDVRFPTVPSFWQNAQFTLSLGGYADASGDLAFFDRTGSSPCISIGASSSLDMSAKLAGINNAQSSKAVQVKSGGKLTWSSAGNQPTLTGSGGDIDVGGTAQTWAAIAALTQSAYLNPNNGAMAGLVS